MDLAVNRHTDFGSGLSMVPQTVLVDFQLSRSDTLVVQSGTNMHIREFVGSSAYVGIAMKVSWRSPANLHTVMAYPSTRSTSPVRQRQQDPSSPSLSCSEPFACW